VSNSAHMAVRDALIAALQAAPALAGGRIVGNRRRPMAAEHAAQIYVYLEESTGTRDTIGTTDWHTRIRVECLARSNAGVSAEDAADALGVAAFARVMADPSLSGAAIDTTAHAIAWVEDEAETQLSACQQIFSVWHATADNTIAS
jgi:hypothetical protein